MADINREKVIEILSRHKTMTFGDKPYDGIQFDLGDVVDLLKEQEPKQVNNIAQQISCFSGICPSCGKMLNTTCNKNFCGKCGHAVKWE